MEAPECRPAVEAHEVQDVGAEISMVSYSHSGREIFNKDSLSSLDMSLHVAELQHGSFAACLGDRTGMLSMLEQGLEKKRGGDVNRLTLVSMARRRGGFFGDV